MPVSKRNVLYAILLVMIILLQAFTCPFSPQGYQPAQVKSFSRRPLHKNSLNITSILFSNGLIICMCTYFQEKYSYIWTKKDISSADEEFLDATCVSDTYATDETMSSKKKNQKTFLRHSSLHSILIGY